VLFVVLYAKVMTSLMTEAQGRGEKRGGNEVEGMDGLTECALSIYHGFCKAHRAAITSAYIFGLNANRGCSLTAHHMGAPPADQDHLIPNLTLAACDTFLAPIATCTSLIFWSSVGWTGAMIAF
jgi:hypothetical protein